MKTRHAFSLGETLGIVLIFGACAAFIAPQFAGASEDERTSNAQIVIGGIRDAIRIYADRARERGNDPYPPVSSLNTPGVVTMRQLPPNPFTGVRGVQAVTRAQAESRAVFNTESAGWNYFSDNSGGQPDLIFYANCRTPTTVPTPDSQPDSQTDSEQDSQTVSDPRPTTMTANEL